MQLCVQLPRSAWKWSRAGVKSERMDRASMGRSDVQSRLRWVIITRRGELPGAQLPGNATSRGSVADHLVDAPIVAADRTASAISSRKRKRASGHFQRSIIHPVRPIRPSIAQARFRRARELKGTRRRMQRCEIPGTQPAIGRERDGHLRATHKLKAVDGHHMPYRVAGVTRPSAANVQPDG